MRTNVKRLIGTILIVAVLVALVMKLRSNKQVADARVYQHDSTTPLPVNVDTLKWVVLNAEKEFSGTFEPNREVKLSVELPGKITKLLVDVGAYVSQGDPLLQIDQNLLQLQLDASDVQVKALEADVNRFAILAEADAIQGVQYEKALIGLESAQVQRDILREQIKKTTLNAPFAGIITAKWSEIGTYAAPGMPLLQLTDINLLRFTIHIPENDLPFFEERAAYSVRVNALEDQKLEGQLIVVGSKSNLANSFPLQFEVRNTTENAIKAGMFGTVITKGTTGEEGLLLPTAALQGSGKQPQVYRLTAEKAVLTEVKIGKRYKDHIVISEGLDAGDVVITAGFINLYDGAPVMVK